MAYQPPKTDWASGDIPTAQDFNRIEGNTGEIPLIYGAIKNLTDTSVTPSANQISEGNDLDNFSTHGVYQSPSAAITNSLLNCPHTGSAFRLEVYKITGASNVPGFILQRILQAGNNNNPKEWIRRIANGVAGNWRNTQPVVGIYTGNGAGGRVITNAMILQTSDPIDNAKTRVIIFDNSNGIYGGGMGPTNGFTAIGSANTSGVAYTYFAWNY